MQICQVIAAYDVIDLLWSKAAFEILCRFDCIGRPASCYFKIAYSNFWIGSEYLFEPSKTQMWRSDKAFFKRITICGYDDEPINRKLLQSPFYDL